MHAAALLCHAPIVVPAIGGARASECATTTAAMRRVAQAVVATQPPWLVVCSPHTPRHADRWGLVAGEVLTGSFARFGHPELALTLPNAASRAREALSEVPLEQVPSQPLDHGAMVPLWFLFEAGWRGPTAVLSVPWANRDAHAIGAALAHTDAALVASGDMSHRLIPGAPAGHDPRAQAFDDAFVASLRQGDLRSATEPDPTLRELAAEDVVDTTEVLRGALGDRVPFDPVVAYEGPFGVGYCEALFLPEPARG